MQQCYLLPLVTLAGLVRDALMYVNQSKNDCLRKLVAIMVIEGVGYSRMMDEKRGGEAQAGWRAAHCPICHTLAFVYGVALSWRWAVMRLVSLGPRFAAEVRGVDLIDVATDDAAYCAVREAFEEHSVILFRNQETCRSLFRAPLAHSSAPRSAPEVPARFMSIAPMSRRTPR
jgi:hypothetical protein